MDYNCFDSENSRNGAGVLGSGASEADKGVRPHVVSSRDRDFLYGLSHGFVGDCDTSESHFLGRQMRRGGLAHFISEDIESCLSGSSVQWPVSRGAKGGWEELRHNPAE